MGIINLDSKKDIELVSNIIIMGQRMNAVTTLLFREDQAKRTEVNY